MAVSDRHRFDPGAKALVLAVLALLAVVMLLLPWVGSSTGWEVLFRGAGRAKIGGLSPRVFAGLMLVCAVAGTPAALWVQRYGAAWAAEIACDITWLFGGLSLWSQQSSPSHAPGPGPGWGLILAEPVVILLALVWASIVWHSPPSTRGRGFGVGPPAGTDDTPPTHTEHHRQ